MSSPPPRFDHAAGTVRLRIDLRALADNWKRMRDASGPARCGAAVKADAYGTGAEQAATRLAREGCRDFFVADANEGAQLRPLLPDSRIYVLNGAFEGALPLLVANDLIPVINSPRQAAFWRDTAGASAYALHVDTGMNRLGLTPEQAVAHARADGVAPCLVMSHFACADEPGHPLNAHQIAAFDTVRNSFPGVEASLANSAGICLGSPALHDLTRPGIALYGGVPVAGAGRTIKTVVTAEARIVQMRHARKGQSVSYGASQILARDTTIAVCGVGYADGFHRAASGMGVPLRDAVSRPGCAAINGTRLPVLGKVTMDLTMVDVTDLEAGAVQPGDWLELLGETISLEEAARAAGTVNYELLTSLGKRYARHYTP